jgi:hypothetical protein
MKAAVFTPLIRLNFRRIILIRSLGMVSSYAFEQVAFAVRISKPSKGTGRNAATDDIGSRNAGEVLESAMPEFQSGERVSVAPYAVAASVSFVWMSAKINAKINPSRPMVPLLKK